MAIIRCLPGTKSLKNQLKYLEKEGKTLKELKEGINCTTDNIEKEFNIVKEMYNKKEGKQYYHYTQAFSKTDKITPEKAHEIGKEWIEKNIKGYQIYLVTHIDKEHIHNHFLINSVSIGRKKASDKSKKIRKNENRK
ncbi:relaxase/mobilization nuclease domain-containing protein (plasmid) [Clostridium perfringens]